MTPRDEALALLDELIREYEQSLTLPNNSEIRPFREQRLARMKSARALLAKGEATSPVASWIEDDQTYPEGEATPVVPSGWRDIETAPKDGTPVLLTDGRRIVDGAWNRGGSMHMAHWMGGIHVPTHWMPLPVPPSHKE